MFKGQIPASMASSMLSLAPESLRIKQLEEQASALRNSVICAFNQLLDLKDLNTGVHSTRLAEWGMRVGQELGLEESTGRCNTVSSVDPSALPHGEPLCPAVLNQSLLARTVFRL